MSNHKFRGGAWIGQWQITWPFITLEVFQDQLILNNELFKKEYRFTHNQIEKIEIKKYIPFFATGIKIHHSIKDYDQRIFFWVFKLKSLTSVLKEFDWLKE